MFEVVFSVCLGLLLFSGVRYVDVKEVSLSVAPQLLASSGSLKVCEAKKSSCFSTLMPRNCERFATKLPLEFGFAVRQPEWSCITLYVSVLKPGSGQTLVRVFGSVNPVNVDLVEVVPAPALSYSLYFPTVTAAPAPV